MKLVAGENFLKPLGGGLGGALERIVIHVHETEPFGVAARPLCGIGSTQPAQGGYNSHVRLADYVATRQSSPVAVSQTTHRTHGITTCNMKGSMNLQYHS